MTPLLLSLLAASAAFAGFVWLALAGLRDGDRPSDVSILPVTAGAGDTARQTVRLRLVNPGPTTALVSLRVDPRHRRPWLGGRRERGGNRARLARDLARGELREGQLLAVPAGGSDVAELALPPERGRATVVAIVGTGRRLRRHRLVVEIPRAANMTGTGATASAHAAPRTRRRPPAPLRHGAATHPARQRPCG